MEVTAHIKENKAVLEVEGKLTVQSSPDLEAVVEKLPSDVCDIDVDLTKVSYVSSAGLRVLVAIEKLTNKREGTMRLLNPVDEVMEVFDMTGLSEVFTVVRE